MGKRTDKTLADAKALSKSVYGVQTRLNEAEKKDADSKYKLNKQSNDIKLKSDNQKAKKEHSEDTRYEKRRDSGLIDRKVWRGGDQITLYDNSKCNGKSGTYTIYFEQDQDKKRDSMYHHMAYFEIKDLETATIVFKALSTCIPCLSSPCMVNNIIGKPYKVVPI